MVLTRKNVAALRHKKLVILMPHRAMRVDDADNYWTRQCCRAIVVEANIDLGITIMGESPNLKDKGDVELVCINRASCDSEAEYRQIMTNMMNWINDGVRNRLEQPEPKGHSMNACAFA